MKEYFVGMIVIALIGTAVISFSPRGYEGHLRLLCAACSVLILLMPMFSFIKDHDLSFDLLEKIFSENDDKTVYYDEYYNKTFFNVEKENAEKMIKSDIKQALLIKSDGFDIEIEAANNNDEYYIELIRVIILPDGAAIDPHSVEKYIKERYGCECVVLYDL
jgi:hypothetical protein